MSIALGADGCPAGWIVASRIGTAGPIETMVVEDASRLLRLARRAPAAAMAIDIPIGLPEQGRRSCDLEARRRLGPRRAASVFFTPPRALLAAEDWETACAMSEHIDGSRISKQTWNIMAKIRDVDAHLSPSDQAWCVEVHPELCFMELAGGAPMAAPKRTDAGKQARARLLSDAFGQDVGRLAEQVKTPRRVAVDDVFDACAALWTAERRTLGVAEQIPASPERDARGLRMEMWV